MKTSVPLLIASDDGDDLNDIHRHLKTIFAHTGGATDTAEGGDFISGRESCVIALAFRTLEDAEEHYTALLRHAIHNRPVRHRTILLCHTHEARDACSAAMRGRFDDFVLFKPLADPCLLRFRSYRLARSLETEERIKRVVGEQAARRSRHITQRAMENVHRDQRRLQQQTVEDHRRLRNQMVHHINNLEVSLDSPEYADAVEVRDRERLGAHLDAGVRNDLEEELAAFKQNLTASIDQLVERYHHIKEEAEGALARITPQAETQAMTVLVVEDDAEVNDTVREFLEMDNHQVLQAFDGDNGYFSAVHNVPDLMLIDIRLPKLSGVELAMKLKAHDKTRFIPIIIVTGNATRQVVESCRRAGVNEFLVKPLTYEVLHEKIETVMRPRGRQPRPG